MGGANNTRNVKEKSTFEDKVNWLLANYNYWGYDYKERSIDKVLLVKAMKHDGLVAGSTFWRDVKLGKALDKAYECKIAETGESDG